jgi:hypothetical protein
MKAIATSDTIGIVLVIFVLFLFFSQVFPKLISVITDNFSKASGENVARQLSGLITVSGAATYKIKIDYVPTTDHTYNIFMKDRTVKVTPIFTVNYAEKASSTQRFAVGLNDYEQEKVNHFVVEKNFDGVSTYVFEAIKE